MAGQINFNQPFLFFDCQNGEVSYIVEMDVFMFAFLSFLLLNTKPVYILFICPHKIKKNAIYKSISFTI